MIRPKLLCLTYSLARFLAELCLVRTRCDEPVVALIDHGAP
jgi:hypothetical protein